MDLTASDVRALRAAAQRNGTTLSAARAAKLIGLGLVFPLDQAPWADPDESSRYALTWSGRECLRARGRTRRPTT